MRLPCGLVWSFVRLRSVWLLYIYALRLAVGCGSLALAMGSLAVYGSGLPVVDDMNGVGVGAWIGWLALPDKTESK